MSDSCETLPWDYFLTDYERDLLQLTNEEAMQKYPKISQDQLLADQAKIREMQADFEVGNGQSRNEEP